MPVQTKAAISAALVRRCLTSVERLDFSWTFGFSDKFTITAECPWRILIAGSVRVGDADHGQTLGLQEPVDVVAVATELLKDRPVEREVPGMATGDLTLVFKGGALLQLLAVSSGYEAWQLNGPGVCIVGHGSDERTAATQQG